MLVLVDLISTRNNVSDAIGKLKRDAETQHIPVIAFAPDDATAELQEAARGAGAALVVSDTAVLNHLGQFLDQALQIE